VYSSCSLLCGELVLYDLPMDRAHLEGLSLAQLKREAAVYRLSVTADRDKLIESILDHFERHGPSAAKRAAFSRMRGLTSGCPSNVTYCACFGGHCSSNVVSDVIILCEFGLESWIRGCK